MPKILQDTINTVGRFLVLLERLEARGEVSPHVRAHVENLVLTPADRALVQTVRDHGGEYTGLFDLSLSAGVAYHHAWDRARELEKMGVISLENKSTIGRPLVIKLLNGYRGGCYE